ncbi:MAG: pyruvate carboxylase [Raineya sp.]|nr:pyruvate carboxylase [Raineya sp.]MDW8295409.1 pyruvate carboxylase [Raineya sp.]
MEHLKPLNKLLVANRGEIAIRILRAASELKIRTVAIYTYEDRYSLHRFKADEAYQIGKDDEPLRPYLDVEEIIALAKKVKADAIHPGYGFLSENVNLARRCREEGIIFVGPEPEVMEALGDKIASKKIAIEAGVPIIEDNKEPLKTFEIALKEAKRIGFPVILKASAGGGGRGMRVVRNESELEKAYNEAKGEAGRSFGDDTIFIEKFIENPKHVEVQIMGDNYGNIVHLFERDCSVQRRFQKVVEVAPSFLEQKTKNKLYDYALRICRKVNYNNVGTVEFLVDKDENVYFIEVNPRIQVEHTITEEITRIDIVRSQILIAKGHRLSDPQIWIHKQEDIVARGVAIQCRITTEDPLNNFKPDFGTIVEYRNAAGFGIRLDEGSVYPGVQISPFFDSMLVKVSASGRTLKGTAQRLHRALREFRIRGVKTNIGFLENVISHPVFQSGKATVNFIQDHPELFNIPKRYDRGTRALRFLANVIVNGNPDVKKKDDSIKFEKPPILHYDSLQEPPAGTKQLLQKMGREKFCEWLKNEKKIYYTDTTLRDGHQSLLATRMRTIDMIPYAEMIAHHFPQTFSMEMWGGATFDVALRFLKECPWRRLQLIRKAAPNILMQMLLRGANAVGYKAYPDNLIEKFIEKSAENGIDIFRIFDSLNWIENLKTSIAAVNKYTESIAEAAICYTGDLLSKNEKKYTLQYYLDLAKRLEDAGAHILAIKDMAGLLKPHAAEVLVAKLKETVRLPIHLHTHDTASIQAATYMKAIEAGVDVIDVAIAAMSGTTAQPNFNSMVAMLQGHPRENPYDLHKLNQVSKYIEAVRKYYYPFEAGLQTGSAEVYEHEMPGGQYTNLKAQADSVGVGDKFDLVVKNYQEANRLFGNIIKVTPSSKVVGDFALFMTANNLTAEDILEKGDTLSFPESVKEFFRGELGQPYGGFPEKLQKMVLKGEKPFTDRPNAHLKPIDFDKEFSEFKEKFDDNFLDFLSYQMYPKVFEEYYNHIQEFGFAYYLPTPAFFYGLKPGEEILIKIDEGKTLLVKLVSCSKPDENGIVTVYFEHNGQTRRVRIFDKKMSSLLKTNPKATAENHIGSPLQGKISQIKVKEGEKVKVNTPLFVLEAMKMESIVTAPREAVVKKIHLGAGSIVEQGDLVVELE